MKNGTTALGFQPRNEQSRTDAPHGTNKLSHRLGRRSMADPWKNSAMTFPQGCLSNGLSSYRRQDDFLRSMHRLYLTFSTITIFGSGKLAMRFFLTGTTMEAGRKSWTSFATRHCAGTTARHTQRRDHGQAVKTTEVESQRLQASHRSRYAGTDIGCSCVFDKHPGLRHCRVGLECLLSSRCDCGN